MISLEQIKLLEKKVSDAVQLIQILKEENKTLKRTIESSQQRMQELEELVTAFKNDQAAIENTVLNAIQKLDVLEDEISDWEAKGDSSPEQVENPDKAANSRQPDAQAPASQPEAASTSTETAIDKENGETLAAADTGNDFELEQEVETVITVDDLQAEDQRSAGFAELQDRPLPDSQSGSRETQDQNKDNAQSDFLFSSQFNLDDAPYESLTINDRKEHKLEQERHQVHGVQLYQNKIYVQRQTEYKELDIF